jgi:hypothetical protein
MVVQVVGSARGPPAGPAAGQEAGGRSSGTSSHKTKRPPSPSPAASELPPSWSPLPVGTAASKSTASAEADEVVCRCDRIRSARSVSAYYASGSQTSDREVMALLG